MIVRVVTVAVLASIGWSLSASADQPLNEIQPADFERLSAAIKPQPGESPWRQIPWLTNVSEARRRAAVEDKPLLVFTAADGSPLGRT